MLDKPKGTPPEKRRVPRLAKDGVSRSVSRDEFGRELHSGIPVAPPIGYKPSPTITEQLRQMVKSEFMAREARKAGMETFEEADDFEVGDDYDPRSPYENDFEPSVKELVSAGQAEIDRKAAEAAGKAAQAAKVEPQAKPGEASGASGEAA